jgi:hypothetical protein
MDRTGWRLRRLASILRLGLADEGFRRSQWQRFRRAVERDGFWRVLLRVVSG